MRIIKELKFMIKKIALLLFLVISFNTGLVFAATEQEVVDEFKQLAKEHIESFKADNEKITFMPRETFGRSNYTAEARWIKDKYIIHNDYQFDVQKTNSLISPYTGVLIFKLDRYVVLSYISKDDVEKNDYEPFNLNNQTEHKHTYAFQDGKWVVKERQQHDPLSTLSGMHEWRNCGNDSRCLERNF